ncbi:MAG TPA: DegT/DnrJ/EryC1/StrS family aminotransferase, partial [Thermoanaerobaculia bacterium]|nr:DegT/DnrJ/EryC1/StrS family aminotransferase [Thermoanaerobaculia bacterium]
LPKVEFARPVARLADREHAYHLYVVRLDTGRLGFSRDEAIARLREAGIGANVHYKPPYLHSYYRDQLGFSEGACPASEKAAMEIVTLPLFPRMADSDVDRVVGALADLAR